jgi:hypothetical protein
MYTPNNSTQDVEDDLTVWRYMSFVSFYSLLYSKSLFFKRLDKYTDEYEGTLPQGTLNAMRHNRLSFPYNQPGEVDKWMSSQVDAVLSHKAFTLSNSWSLSEDENYALWKIYLYGNAEGIAIRTTVRRLKDSFNDNHDYSVYTGKVTYGNLLKDLNVYTVSTIKRKAYAYEQEYRAFLVTQSKVEDIDGIQKRMPKYEIGIGVPINLSTLIEKIYISPFGGKWFREPVENALTTYMPLFNLENIIQSDIKDK